MRKSTLVLSCVAVAMAAAASWFWQQWQYERSVKLEPRGQTAGLECQAALATEIAAPPDSSTSPVPTAKPVREMNAGMPALPPGFAASVEPRLMNDPEFRRALRSQQRVNLEDQFHDLPKVLGLSSEQTDRLFDLLAEQQVRIHDARWLKPEAGKTVFDAYEEARAKNQVELASFLGPSNMIRYQEFRATLESRIEVTSVRNELARGPEPLRENQVDSMIAVVNPELQRLKQELRELDPLKPPGTDPATDGKRSELTIATNQRILDAARPILTSEQLAGLEELYRRQRLQMEAESAMNRLRFAAAADTAQGFAPK